MSIPIFSILSQWLGSHSLCLPYTLPLSWHELLTNEGDCVYVIHEPAWKWLKITRTLQDMVRLLLDARFRTRDEGRCFVLLSLAEVHIETIHANKKENLHVCWTVLCFCFFWFKLDSQSLVFSIEAASQGRVWLKSDALQQLLPKGRWAL